MKKNINDKPFQVIESQSIFLEGPFGFLSPDSSDDPITIDMNFDGYNDLSFTKGSGYGPFWTNISYEFYLYNPISNKFEYNYDLSGLINPEPYSDQKKIYCYTKMNFMGTNSLNQEYVWNENKLEETASYEYNVLEDSLLQNGTCCQCICIKRLYLNGNYVKTDTTIIDVKNIPKEHFVVY